MLAQCLLVFLISLALVFFLKNHILFSVCSREHTNCINISVKGTLLFCIFQSFSANLNLELSNVNPMNMLTTRLVRTPEAETHRGYEGQFAPGKEAMKYRRQNVPWSNHELVAGEAKGLSGIPLHSSGFYFNSLVSKNTLDREHNLKA